MEGTSSRKEQISYQRGFPGSPSQQRSAGVAKDPSPSTPGRIDEILRNSSLTCIVSKKKATSIQAGVTPEEKSKEQQGGLLRCGDEGVGRRPVPAGWESWVLRWASGAGVDVARRQGRHILVRDGDYLLVADGQGAAPVSRVWTGALGPGLLVRHQEGERE